MASSHDQAIADEYAFVAKSYDRRWAAYLEATLGAALTWLEVGAGERVLDLGCGSGLLLERLAGIAPGGARVGVDRTPEMLALARRRLGAEVALALARAEQLPFASSCFDWVVSTSALHHFRAPEDTLSEIRRVLRPGGRVVIGDWCADFFAMRLLDRWRRIVSASHQRCYTSTQLARLLERAGFEAIHCVRHRSGRLWGLMLAQAREPGPLR